MTSLTLLSRDGLAWAAGFFDGEGTTGATHQKRTPGRHHLCCNVTQTERGILERFRRAVGGLGKIYGPFGAQGRWRPRYNWTTGTFEQAQAVIAMLWVFLGETKRAQAKRALLTMRDQRPVRSRFKTFCIRGHDMSVTRTVSIGGHPYCRQAGALSAWSEAPPSRFIELHYEKLWAFNGVLDPHCGLENAAKRRAAKKGGLV